MSPLLITVVAVAGYLLATQRLVRHVFQPDVQRQAALMLAGVGVAAHAFAHAHGWWMGGGPNLHFFAALSLVGLGMAAMTLLAPLAQRMDALGVVVYPAATLTLLLYMTYGQSGASPLDWRIQLHATLALLAYATLAIAAVLAGLLWLQERALRQRKLTGVLRALPPLTQLESLLFRTIGAGFFMLTLALVSGVLFVQDLLAQHLAHKTFLSALAWLVFGLLLLGRWRFGWRGRRAVRLTLLAMALLALSFFGSKFVLEILLHRA